MANEEKTWSRFYEDPKKHLKPNHYNQYMRAIDASNTAMGKLEEGEPSTNFIPVNDKMKDGGNCATGVCDVQEYLNSQPGVPRYEIPGQKLVSKMTGEYFHGIPGGHTLRKQFETDNKPVTKVTPRNVGFIKKLSGNPLQITNRVQANASGDATNTTHNYVIDNSRPKSIPKYLQGKKTEDDFIDFYHNKGGDYFVRAKRQTDKLLDPKLSGEYDGARTYMMDRLMPQQIADSLSNAGWHQTSKSPANPYIESRGLVNRIGGGVPTISTYSKNLRSFENEEEFNNTLKGMKTGINPTNKWWSNDSMFTLARDTPTLEDYNKVKDSIDAAGEIVDRSSPFAEKFVDDMRPVLAGLALQETQFDHSLKKDAQDYIEGKGWTNTIKGARNIFNTITGGDDDKSWLREAYRTDPEGTIKSVEKDLQERGKLPKGETFAGRIPSDSDDIEDFLVNEYVNSNKKPGAGWDKSLGIQDNFRKLMDEASNSRKSKGIYKMKAEPNFYTEMGLPRDEYGYVENEGVPEYTTDMKSQSVAAMAQLMENMTSAHRRLSKDPTFTSLPQAEQYELLKKYAIASYNMGEGNLRKDLYLRNPKLSGNGLDYVNRILEGAETFSSRKPLLNNTPFKGILK